MVVPTITRRESLLSVVDVTIAAVVATPSFPKRLTVHCVKNQDTVAHALRYLSHHKIMRAPLLDATGTPIALIDVLDLLKYAVLDVHNEASSVPLEANLPRFKDLASCAVPNIYHNRNKLIVLNDTDKLSLLLEAFAAGRHNVLVKVEGGKDYMISQSDILKYLDDEPMAYKNINGKTLPKLGLYKPDSVMQTIPSTSTVGAAYRALYGSHAAVPIVDAEGRITGTLSTSDLKYTDPSDLTHLNMNVMDFLNGDESRGAGAPVSVQMDAFIGEVILLLSHASVTRVWVVNPDKRPVGVVSCTDVINKVLHVTA